MTAMTRLDKYRVIIVDDIGYVVSYVNSSVYKFTLDSQNQLVNFELFASYGGMFKAVNIFANSMNVLVNSYGSHNSVLFDLCGNVVFEYGGYGSGDGQMMKAYGSHIDDWGRHIVCDRDNNRIVLLSPEGNLITYLVTGADGMNSRPIGLVVHQRVMYVTTYTDPRKLYSFEFVENN